MNSQVHISGDIIGGRPENQRYAKHKPESQLHGMDSRLTIHNIQKTPRAHRKLYPNITD